MPRWALQVLDIGFFVVHSAIVVFNVTGWMFERTRRANLILLLLTLASWLLMGAVYGVGYCVCADWHFRVRHALGYQDQGDTYIGFVVWKLTGYLPPSATVRLISGVGLGISLVMSLFLNWKDRERRKGPVSAKASAL